MRMTPAHHYPGRAPIDAYGNGGFRFADMSHRGSLLALPDGIYGWQPATPPVFTLGDFRLLLDATARPEVLLVGTGTSHVPQAPDLLAVLRAEGMSVDVMGTGAAARTYNILLSEDRSVAAALLAV